MNSLLDHIPPSDLDLPDRFDAFRPAQSQIAEFALYGPGGADASVLEEERKFRCAGAPPGVGKSLAAMAIARLSGAKTVICTATRALEDQMATDFAHVGLVNIRGRANYQCVGEPSREKVVDCREGEEEGCEWAGRPGRCPYSAKVAEAREADVVLTNYQYWMNVRARNAGALETPTRPIETLILDEFHKGPEEVARFLSVWVGHTDLRKWGGDEAREIIARTHGAEHGRVDADWVGMLGTAAGRVALRLAGILADNAGQAPRKSKEFRRLTKLLADLERVAELGPGTGIVSQYNNWIWKVTRLGIAFECVWPGRYTDRYLWRGIPRVVPMSATLRPKALTLGGIPERDRWFKEWPRVFLPQNSPVYWVPTGRMGGKTGEAGQQISVAKGDEIIAEWGHLKGIVHTPSYELARYYQANSKYGRYMILNEQGQTGSTQAAAERYRQKDVREGPVILVSPSFSTGWDFPNSDCDWQWIPKLPYANKSDPVVIARMETDDQIYSYDCMQQFVQACYRGTRHGQDRCVTICTDDAVKGFRNYAREHAPRWFSVLDAPGGRIPRAPAR